MSDKFLENSQSDKRLCLFSTSSINQSFHDNLWLSEVITPWYCLSPGNIWGQNNRVHYYYCSPEGILTNFVCWKGTLDGTVMFCLLERHRKSTLLQFLHCKLPFILYHPLKEHPWGHCTMFFSSTEQYHVGLISEVIRTSSNRALSQCYRIIFKTFLDSDHLIHEIKSSSA